MITQNSSWILELFDLLASMKLQLLPLLLLASASTLAHAQTYRMHVPAKTLKVEAPLQIPSGGPAQELKPGFDVSTGQLQFGEVAVGASTQGTFSVLNTGETNLEIPASQIFGESFQANHACSVLAPGAACPVTVFFQPAEPQEYQGRADVSILSLGTKSVVLAGKGLGSKFALKGAPPSEHTFPATATGTPAPAPLVLTLTNTGNRYGTSPMPAVTGPNADDFSVTSSCSGPSSVAAGADCSVTVSFAPKAEGTRSASVKVVDTTFQLTGTGTKPVVYATWDRATTPAYYALSNGNLQLGAAQSGTGSITQGAGAKATVGKSSGKWYWEVSLLPNAKNMMIGLVPSSVNTMAGQCTGCGNLYARNWRIAYASGTWDGFGAIAPTSSNYSTPGLSAMRSSGVGGGDVYGFALDMDTRTFRIYYKRAGGACEGPFATWTGLAQDTYYPAASVGSSAPMTTIANFGQNAFACTPPAGHQPLAQ